MELLADEAVHHLRTCLDHLLSGWIESRTRKVRFNVQFPILEEEPKTEKAWKAFDKLIEGVAPATRQAIIDLQPYKRGDAAKTHPLWRLNRVDNLFKHSTLHLITLQMGYRHVPGLITKQTGRAHDSGDVFAEVPINVDVEKDFEPYLSMRVVFGSERMRVEGIGLEALHEIYNFIRDEVMRKAIKSTERWPNRLT